MPARAANEALRRCCCGIRLKHNASTANASDECPMHLPEPLPIATARTTLRRLSTDDVAAFQAYRTDPEVGRWQGW
jgi:hypothetical protein